MFSLRRFRVLRGDSYFNVKHEYHEGKHLFFTEAVGWAPPTVRLSGFKDGEGLVTILWMPAFAGMTHRNDYNVTRGLASVRQCLSVNGQCSQRSFHRLMSQSPAKDLNS
ncbi:MAG: hypothetical protein AB1746_17380 [Candidatus Zixiibacteriota bacterium]